MATKYKVGSFTYPNLHPPVRAVQAFANKRIDAGFVSSFLRGLEDLARGIAGRSVVVRWADGQQDHSYTRDDGVWVIVANPARLVRQSVAAPAEATASSVATCASVLGAVVHEVAHVLYSPQTHAASGRIQKLTRDELAFFRTYEDLYVNSCIIRQRAPGLLNLQPYAYNWLSPADMVQAAINGNADGNGTPFERAVSAVGADFFAFINGKRAAEFPAGWQAELTTRLRPIRDRFAAGEVMPWEKRHRLLKRAVKVTYAVLHKYGMYDPPPSEGGQSQQPQQEPGERGEAGSGQGQPSEGPQDSPPDGAGDEGAGEEGDMDGLNEVPVPEQWANETPSCGHSDQLERKRATQTGVQSLTKRANAEADAAETGFDTGPTMEKAVISPAIDNFPTDHYDRERAGMLKRVFRTYSQTRRGWLHGAESGKLSSRRLAALASGSSPNIFKERAKVRGTQGAVLILVDSSGSMRGKPYEQAALAARELYEAIGRNPDYQTHVWAYSGSGNMVEVTAARYAGGQLFWPPANGGSTPSWRAMSEAAQWLKAKYPRTKRVIIHLTDTLWNDRYIPEFTEHVEQDGDLDYITIGIRNTYGDSLLDARMRVSRCGVENLVGAVQEFATKAFKG